jgi:serine phosphatase RsbU (regulator of sigma subunit)
VTEATNAVGEEFGTDRITRIVKKHQHESSKEICDAIFSANEKFMGRAKAKDDRTVMVIKR